MYNNTYFVEIVTTNGEQSRYVIEAISIEEAAMKARMFHIANGRAVGGSAYSGIYTWNK